MRHQPGLRDIRFAGMSSSDLAFLLAVKEIEESCTLHFRPTNI